MSAATILSDGVKNTRSAVRDLRDARARTFDDAEPHPGIGEVKDYLGGLDWVAEVGVRARDEGHVFHVECFVVPRDGHEPDIDQIEKVRTRCTELDWRMQDVVIIPVRRIPDELSDAGRNVDR